MVLAAASWTTDEVGLVPRPIRVAECVREPPTRGALVVDHEPTLRRSALRQLYAGSDDVMSATDGVEATELSDEYEFDVLPSDVRSRVATASNFFAQSTLESPTSPCVLNPRRTGRGYRPKKSAGVRGVSLSHQDRRPTHPRTGVKQMACSRRKAAMKRRDAELFEHQLGDRYLRSMRASLGRASQIRRAMRDEAAEGVRSAPCRASLFATLRGTDVLAAHQISDHSPLAIKADRGGARPRKLYRRERPGHRRPRSAVAAHRLRGRRGRPRRRRSAAICCRAICLQGPAQRSRRSIGELGLGTKMGEGDRLI